VACWVPEVKEEGLTHFRIHVRSYALQHVPEMRQQIKPVRPIHYSVHDEGNDGGKGFLVFEGVEYFKGLRSPEGVFLREVLDQFFSIMVVFILVGDDKHVNQSIQASLRY
jgi:hypothetical protein